MHRDELVSYLNTYLRLDQVEDYGPQGLQVEGTDEVTRVALSVDSGLPCIDAAVKIGAQMQIVHHGLFWGQTELIRGPFARKLRRLLQSNVNLYAAHLALDAHPEVGNNVELARLFGLSVDSWFCNIKGTDIGVICPAPKGLTLDALLSVIKETLAVEPRVLAHGPAGLRRVAIVSGGGVSHAFEAAALGADTFITGETSHSHFYDALHYGMNIIFAGHYATETVGLRALGRHLGAKFGLETVFYDLPTGM